MARLVKKTAHEPIQVGDKHICMCGLSKNQPFCDGSHRKTLSEDESKLYWYDEEGNSEEITTNSEECCGECDGSCCHEEKHQKKND